MLSARELTNQVTQATPVGQTEEVPRQQTQAPLGNFRCGCGSRVSGRIFCQVGECLPGGVGWWKYEICYGRHVIQFHVNESFLERRKECFCLFLRRKVNIEHQFY